MQISNRSLGELLGKSLTSTPCVNIRKNAKIRVATGMPVQYLETFTDSIVVRDESKPIGVIGGREIIQGVYKNPTSDFFEMNLVENITDRRLKISTPNTNLEELISLWREAKRAFAVINTGNDDYSVISAKKLLEIAVNHKVEFNISEIPKKNIVTFNDDATFGDIIKLMLENKCRKILLDGTTQFVNDRMIIESIEKLDYLLNKENFLNIPINVLNYEDAKIVSEDMSITDVSKIMYNLPHPLVMYNDQVISPWDICIALGKN